MLASDLLAPQLADRHENSRFIAVKLGHSLRDLTKQVLGPKHMAAKLIAILVLAVGLFVFICRPMYHVSAAFPTDCDPQANYLRARSKALSKRSASIRPRASATRPAT